LLPELVALSTAIIALEKNCGYNVSAHIDVQHAGVRS